MKILLLIAALVATGRSALIDETLLYGKFPDNFIWAAATSAYQIEGAWNVGGRKPSIWDTFVRQEGSVADGSTGDDACKSYEFYQKDVELLQNLGVSYYRFSISWSRVMSDAYGTPNPAGIQYYKNLIAALKAADIQPMVTMYHWDLPQSMGDMGGFLNSTFADWFETYADLLYREYGAEVKYWITFNEPWCTAYLGYGVGSHAPGLRNTGTDDYTAAHNLLRAHAKAYRLYESTYKASQQGKVGITLNIGWDEPEDGSAENIAAAERSIQFAGGWFANPIFGSGDYPAVMKDQIGRKSAAQGFSKSRLPEFTAAEIQQLKGSADFFGLNYYTSGYIRNKVQDINLISYDTDKDVEGYQDPAWFGAASSWLKIVPWGLRKLLNYLKDTYNNPPIIITENGYSDKEGYLDDAMRVYYFKYNINNVLKAIDDGVNVFGYTAWSLMDNFEWGMGYTERFGVHYVNYSDPQRTRVPKDSARYFASLIKRNGFVPQNFDC